MALSIFLSRKRLRRPFQLHFFWCLSKNIFCFLFCYLLLFPSGYNGSPFGHLLQKCQSRLASQIRRTTSSIYRLFSLVFPYFRILPHQKFLSHESYQYLLKTLYFFFVMCPLCLRCKIHSLQSSSGHFSSCSALP